MLPSGTAHGRATEMLASETMASLLEDMASRYADRIIVFDSPPLLATTEARALASHMGQIVMVVQADRTTQVLVKHALETIDTDLAVPAGSAPEKVEAYKKYLRATALLTIGTVQYKREQYADAEGNLRKAIEADAENPDPVVILRLALALDQQKKYPEALQQANRAIALTQDTTDVGKMARNERDRLVVVTGGNNTPAAPAPPAAGSQTPAPPSH